MLTGLQYKAYNFVQSWQNSPRCEMCRESFFFSLARSEVWSLTFTAILTRALSFVSFPPCHGILSFTFSAVLSLFLSEARRLRRAFAISITRAFSSLSLFLPPSLSHSPDYFIARKSQRRVVRYRPTRSLLLQRREKQSYGESEWKRKRERERAGGREECIERNERVRGVD